MLSTGAPAQLVPGSSISANGPCWARSYSEKTRYRCHMNKGGGNPAKTAKRRLPLWFNPSNEHEKDGINTHEEGGRCRQHLLLYVQHTIQIDARWRCMQLRYNITLDSLVFGVPLPLRALLDASTATSRSRYVCLHLCGTEIKAGEVTVGCATCPFPAPIILLNVLCGVFSLFLLVCFTSTPTSTPTPTSACLPVHQHTKHQQQHPTSTLRSTGRLPDISSESDDPKP